MDLKNKKTELLLTYIRKIRSNTMTVKDIPSEDIDLVNDLEMSIEEIIEAMQKVSNTISELSEVKMYPIAQHLNYHLNLGRSFDDKKYDHAFSDKNSIQSYAQNSAKVQKNHDKLLDFSFREKLSGFTSKERKLSWPDDKIQEFLDSIFTARNINTN